jgi:hypothetical protein
VSRFGWGGRREGAGRKPSPDSGAPHTARPRVHSGDHVRLDYAFSDTHPARDPRARRAVRRTVQDAVNAAARRFGFRISGWRLHKGTLSVFGDGARSTGELARAAQGLGVRVARNVNKRLGTNGKLFADRYRLAVL